MNRGKPRRGRGVRPAKQGAADPESVLGAGEMRLQKLLARAGASSRRGGEELIREGRVRVNGRVVTELGTKVHPARDTVLVDGKALQVETPTYIVLNKPDGFVSSAEPEADPRGRPTVMSLVRGLDVRVVPVGRLDFHSRGLLLLTNDGDFAARMTHPRYKIPKTYHVKFQGRLEEDILERLRTGVQLDDGVVTQPLPELWVIRQTETNTWVQMTLLQGLNRQIRRMGDAVERPVLKLLRVAIGEITTDGLPEGKWRHLRESEVAELKGAIGHA